MATEMKLITDITLELTGETKRYEVVAKQGDKATRFVRITLKNNGQDFEIPAGMKVIANIQKPDRKCCYNTCSYSGSTVTMELTNQALAVAGTAECDIEIRDANDEVVLSSQAFTIEIEKSMRDENAIRSSNEFTQLEQDVREYAAEYLEKNPVQPTPIDKTLTKENEAADAAKVGIELEKKLGGEVLKSEKVSGLYVEKTLYNLNSTDGMIKGKFENNIPIEDEEGNAYFTPFIEFGLYESLVLTTEKGSPFVRFYDAEQNFLSSKYAGGIIKNFAPETAVYIVIQANTSGYYGDTYKLTYNGEYENQTLILESKGTKNYSIIQGRMETDEIGTMTDLIPVIKGESYDFDAPGNGYYEFYNASGIKIGNQTQTKKATFTIPIDGEITHVKFGGYNSNKATLDGKFFIQKMTNPELKLVSENFDADMLVTLRQLLNIGAGTGGTFYNALDYGMTESAEDNTAALQAAMDAVAEEGGGIIWIPKGTYLFKSSRVTVNSGNMEGAVWAKSKVSILGESLSGTVLKMTGDSACGKGFALFAYHDNTTPLEGCTYTNFTVDGADMVISSYNHQGKAFYYHNIKDCVFRDLRLLNTPATALGIDMLVNTVMDSIYCENCGREWVYDTGNGGAGIGIGTGKFANENYVIRNCICVGCGHFGIFLEDQGIFSAAKDKNYPKGAIVANNICRNGRYGGIGLRGGRYVLIQNNICYENHDVGIEIDYGIKDCDVLNNTCYDNGESGIAVENIVDGEKKDLNFSGNRLTGNGVGIKINSATERTILSHNIVMGNTKGITAIVGQKDTVIKYNIITDSKMIDSGAFTGDTSMNELV